MKILAVSHSCVADVNQQLFVALDQLPEVEVELIVPSNWKSEYSGKTETPTLLPAVEFPIHFMPVAMPGHVSLHFYKYLPVKYLRRFQPDVLLSAQEPWSLSGFQAAWLSRKLNAPFVFQTNQNIFKRYPLPFSWIEDFSYRTAEMALAYSEEARGVMVRKGLKRPSEVVPYATDISLFKKTDSRALRDELGLSDSLVLGYMGRFVPEKGIDTLVEAMRILHKQKSNVNIKALMVGTGPEEEHLRRLIAEAGLQSYFVFTGAVPHLQASDYMNCIDIFVLPSRTTPTWKEQFGRVIIEALACGIPIVGSDSGQIPILIEETGGGLVFAEGNATDLHGKLLRLIDDANQRHQFGRKGCLAVHNTFTYEAVASRLHCLLKSVVTSQVCRSASRPMISMNDKDNQ